MHLYFSLNSFSKFNDTNYHTLFNACNKHIIMKTGYVKKDGKSYAYIEFESKEEIDKFFDEVEKKAKVHKPSYEARSPK